MITNTHDSRSGSALMKVKLVLHAFFSNGQFEIEINVNRFILSKLLPPDLVSECPLTVITVKSTLLLQFQQELSKSLKTTTKS